MNSIMKAIAILQAVRNALENTPHYTMSEPFCFAEEIRRLQEAIAMLSPPADEPADEPERQSCEHGIDVDVDAIEDADLLRQIGSGKQLPMGDWDSV